MTDMLRKILISFIIFILLQTPLLLAQPNNQDASVNWHSMEELSQLMKKEKRYIIVDIYTDWCGWCNTMEKKTYSNPQIVSYINNNFYAVKLNAETKKTIQFKGKTYKNKGGKRSIHELAKIFLQDKQAFPSTGFMNKDLKIMAVIPGYIKPGMMEPLINFFGEGAYKKTDWKTYKQNFTTSLK